MSNYQCLRHSLMLYIGYIHIVLLFFFVQQVFSPTKKDENARSDKSKPINSSRRYESSFSSTFVHGLDGRGGGGASLKSSCHCMHVCMQSSSIDKAIHKYNDCKKRQILSHGKAITIESSIKMTIHFLGICQADDATEGVDEHSSRLQPSINSHAPFTYFLHVQLLWYRCITPDG